MNPLLTTIKTSLDIIRELNASSVKEAATERADEMLGRYGYHREPSVSQQILSHGASFGVGMAVGAGLGLLFAPHRGDETREKLADGANDVFTQLNEAMRDVWPVGAKGDDARVSDSEVGDDVVDPVRNPQRSDMSASN